MFSNTIRSASERSRGLDRIVHHFLCFGEKSRAVSDAKYDLIMERVSGGDQNDQSKCMDASKGFCLARIHWRKYPGRSITQREIFLSSSDITLAWRDAIVIVTASQSPSGVSASS